MSIKGQDGVNYGNSEDIDFKIYQELNRVSITTINTLVLLVKLFFLQD